MPKVISCLVILIIASVAVVGQNTETKEFRSEQYQFSIKYPVNWTNGTRKDYSFTDGRRDNYGVVMFVSPVVWDEDQQNAAAIIICSQPKGQELVGLAKDACRPRDAHLSDLWKNRVLSRKQIKIDGVDAERIETVSQDKELFHYYVSFATKERTFFITGTFFKHQSDVFDTFKYEPEFDKFLASFRFLS
ncbi:MAG TPA: hypothetical protein VJU86_12515 [Pyrinomonadaceae bacterium]|nr:hypothetical protein [Pyrinomonadaceae bacterium]